MSQNRFFIEKDKDKFAIVQYATKNICGYNKKLKLSGFEEAVTAGNFLTKYLDPDYYFLTEKWRINY